MSLLTAAGYTLGSALNGMAKYGGAAASSNATSWASQSAQGQFNQNSANMANDLATQRLMQQYQFNSAMMNQANAFNMNMWNAQAEYNSYEAALQRAWQEYMMEKSMAYNSAEAQKGRDWQQFMYENRYQMAMADMKAAGLNPILAYGGINGSAGASPTGSIGTPTGATASAGLSSSAQTSGGLLQGVSASEGNFTGAMDLYSGLFGLIGSALSSMSSAMANLGQMGGFGQGLANWVAEKILDQKNNNSNPLEDVMKKMKIKEQIGKTLPK